MAKAKIRGIAHRDVRTAHRPNVAPLRERVRTFFNDSARARISIIVILILMMLFPILAWISPLILFPLAYQIYYSSMTQLPMRIPGIEKMADPSDPKPGRKSYAKADGVLLLGYAVELGMQQVWLNKRDLCTHFLMLGTTGAGKTYNFFSIIANMVSMGSGGYLGDAKGAGSLGFDATTVLRALGREDDMLVISLLTGTRDVTRKTSHTLNVTSGSAAEISELMVGMAPSTEGNPNAVFVNNGNLLMRALIKVLVYRRDHLNEPFDMVSVRDYLQANSLDKLMLMEDLPLALKADLASPLEILGYKTVAERSAGQPRPPKNSPHPPISPPHSEEFTKQLSFAVMNFSEAISQYAGTYGYIFAGKLAEINWVDVFRNRRCVISLLPSLELSESSVASSGRMLLNGAKNAISKRLESRMEGTRDDVINSASDAAQIPVFLCSDEHAQLGGVAGVGAMMALARSLKVCVGIGTQSWVRLQSANEGEASQIWSNARTAKICGAIEDQTGFDLFSKAAGEALVVNSANLELGGISPIRSRDVQLQSQAMMNFQDIQSQIEGEAHVLFPGAMYRMQLFNPAIEPTKTFKLNRFLRVGEYKLPVPGEPNELASATNEPELIQVTNDSALERTQEQDLARDERLRPRERVRDYDREIDMENEWRRDRERDRERDHREREHERERERERHRRREEFDPILAEMRASGSMERASVRRDERQVKRLFPKSEPVDAMVGKVEGGLSPAPVMAAVAAAAVTPPRKSIYTGDDNDEIEAQIADEDFFSALDDVSDEQLMGEMVWRLDQRILHSRNLRLSLIEAMNTPFALNERDSNALLAEVADAVAFWDAKLSPQSG